MDGRYNTRSPAVKRLMREAQELSEPTDQYFAQPLDDNLFEWHFTIRGPADSDFQNGIYHGRIILPVDYPMKPPSIIWLTPNGRFETYKKICLSISGHHPESWQPSWSIRTALLAIIGFMPTHPGGAIGSLDYTPEERKVLAKKTKDWKCPTCGEITGILLDVNPNTQTTSDEAKELAAQINLQGEKPKCKDGECPVEQAKIAEMQSEAKESQSGAAAEPEGTQDSSDPGAVNAETNATNYTNATTAPTQTGAQAFAWPPFLAPNQQQTAIPQFPQWSPMAGGFPMPPMGFPPFPYPGMPPMPPMAHMQFPYPPSHYPAFPQFPWLPQPPAPSNPVNTATPPPPSSSASISANNSANQEPNIQAETDFSSNKNTDNYTRSPMTTPIRTNTSPARTSGVSTSNAGASSSNNGPANDRDEGIKNNKGLVFKELLSKVNRVGSDIVNKEENDPQLVAQTVLSDNQEESRPEGSKIAFKQKLSELAKKKLKMEDASDSEVSTQKKLGRRSVSEKGDTNTEDNSDSDVPPIEADQNSALEKGGCSSTSDLDKCKQRYSTTKGIRQRQSTTATANSTTTANVPSGLTEEGAPPVEPERAEAGTVQQRIEAISGDTGNRNRSRLAARLANNANLANRAEFDRRNRQGSYDVGFYLMVGLFATSMLILFNRLVSMEWSDSDI